MTSGQPSPPDRERSRTPRPLRDMCIRQTMALGLIWYPGSLLTANEMLARLEQFWRGSQGFGGVFFWFFPLYLIAGVGERAGKRDCDQSKGRSLLPADRFAENDHAEAMPTVALATG